MVEPMLVGVSMPLRVRYWESRFRVDSSKAASKEKNG
jgi:hypothetical protein